MVSADLLIRRRLRPSLHHLRLFLVAVVAAIATGLLPAPVDAHARLIASTPAAGSALAAMPGTIELMFNEALDPGLSEFRLTDATGATLPLGEAIPDPANPAVLTFRIDALNPPPGVYTLVWRVLSAVDGHVTSGTVPFSVGTGEAPVTVTTGADERPPWWQIGPRWFELSGWVLMAGLAGFGALNYQVMRSVNTTWRRGAIDRWKSAWFFAFTLALSGMIADIAAQTLKVSGATSLAVPNADDLGSVLADTDYGRGWLLRLAIGVVLLLVPGIMPRLDRRWSWLVMTLLAIAAMVTISATGHAGGETRKWLAVFVDVLHMSCVAIWLGGLVALVLAIRQAHADGDPTNASSCASLVRNHSRTSLLAMATIIGSGVLSASFHVGGYRSLRSEDYGLTLLVKIALLVVVLVAATINLLILLPQIRHALSQRDSERAWSFLRSTRAVAGLEVATASLILLASAVLTLSVPADYPQAVTVAGRALIVDQTLQADDLSIAVQAELRGNPGDRFVIDVADADGQPPEQVQRVIIETELLTGPDAGLGDRFDANSIGGSDATFGFPATRLGIAGEWAVNIVVRRAGVEDVEAGFQVDTSGTVAGQPRLVRDSWTPLPRMTWAAWGFLILAIVVLVAGLAGMRRLTGMEPVASGVILALCVLIASGFIVSATRQTVPVTDGRHLVNPLPGDAIVLKQGESLYAANCLLCHGADGRGTTAGPGMTHQAADADLMVSATRRAADGDLFTWISEGVPGTDMPAFEVALSEDERWSLVHYLRQLQTDED